MPQENTDQGRFSFSLPIVILAFLGLIALCAASPYLLLTYIDRRGDYYNTTSVADLDGDGDLDVVLLNLRDEPGGGTFHGLTLWINDDGRRVSPKTFETQPNLYLSAGSADFDRDGDMDIALLAPNQVEFFMNQGGTQEGETGVFRSMGLTWPAGNFGTPGSLHLGDLNNDGTLDGFVAGCCGMYFGEMYNSIPSVSWKWINGPDPDKAAGRMLVKYKELHDLPIRAAALGDLDGDGYLDAFAAVRSQDNGKEVYETADLILLNDGQGIFTDSGQRLGETDSTAVALSDIDGDGDLDALVGTTSGVSLWINQGGAQAGQTGRFAAAAQTLGAGSIVHLFVEDLNGDGYPDAMIGTKNRAVIWHNDGQGEFSPTGWRFRYSKRHGLASGDFNGDGLRDIFAGSYDQNYNIWLNQGNGAFHLVN